MDRGWESLTLLERKVLVLVHSSSGVRGGGVFVLGQERKVLVFVGGRGGLCFRTLGEES